jgi:hypothetical protein
VFRVQILHPDAPLFPLFDLNAKFGLERLQRLGDRAGLAPGQVALLVLGEGAKRAMVPNEGKNA